MLKITGLNASAYPGGWPDYNACISEDRDYWARAASTFDKDEDGGTLTIRYLPASDVFWCAYFAPFSMERHHDLVADAASCEGVDYVRLGTTLDGQPDRLPRTGRGRCEGMALRPPASGRDPGRMVDGRRHRMSDRSGRSGRAGAAQGVPHSYRAQLQPPMARSAGILRTNAVGSNLNREWATPTPEKSPEVLAIRNRMDQTGVDFAMDVHADEAIPAVFLAGFEGIPSWTEAQGEGY